MQRGDVYWGNPTYPDGSGGKSQDHRCLLLRTPSGTDHIVPILTLHTVRQVPRSLNDCCHVLVHKQYSLKAPTYLDARMTMFAHLTSFRNLAFQLCDDDLEEVDFCLINALQLPGFESE